jgi:hypothetical protein
MRRDRKWRRPEKRVIQPLWQYPCGESRAPKGSKAIPTGQARDDHLYSKRRNLDPWSTKQKRQKFSVSWRTELKEWNEGFAQ